jgi:hypothetical protein
VARAYLLTNPFSAGAHGYCGQIVSFYNAIYLLIFGDSLFVWRMSAAAVLIPCSVIMHLWLRELFDSRVATVAVLLLNASFAIQNFFILGYGNQSTLVPFLLINLFLTRAYLRPGNQLILMLLVGTTLGIGFYHYIGVVLPVATFPYLVLLGFSRGWWNTFKLTIGIIAVGIIWLIPMCFDPSYGLSLVEIIAFHNEPGQLPGRFPMILRTFRAFFENLSISYYVVGPYFDSISAAFLALGMARLFQKMRSSPSHAVILSQFLLFLIAMGLTHRYSDPPFQRNFLLMPLACAIAAVGVITVTSPLGRNLRYITMVVLSVAIIGNNQFRRELSIFHYGVSPETCLLMRIDAARKRSPDLREVYVVTTVPNYLLTTTMLMPHFGITGIDLKIFELFKPSNMAHSTVIPLDAEAVLQCRFDAVAEFARPYVVMSP